MGSGDQITLLACGTIPGMPPGQAGSIATSAPSGDQLKMYNINFTKCQVGQHGAAVYCAAGATPHIPDEIRCIWIQECKGASLFFIGGTSGTGQKTTLREFQIVSNQVTEGLFYCPDLTAELTDCRFDNNDGPIYFVAAGSRSFLNCYLTGPAPADAPAELTRATTDPISFFRFNTDLCPTGPLVVTPNHPAPTVPPQFIPLASTRPFTPSSAIPPSQKLPATPAIPPSAAAARSGTFAATNGMSYTALPASNKLLATPPVNPSPAPAISGKFTATKVIQATVLPVSDKFPASNLAPSAAIRFSSKFDRSAAFSASRVATLSDAFGVTEAPPASAAVAASQVLPASRPLVPFATVSGSPAPSGTAPSQSRSDFPRQTDEPNDQGTGTAKKDGDIMPLIIGCACGGVVLIVIAVAVALYCRSRRRRFAGSGEEGSDLIEAPVETPEAYRQLAQEQADQISLDFTNPMFEGGDHETLQDLVLDDDDDDEEGVQ
jgi:hypothetical protein